MKETEEKLETLDRAISGLKELVFAMCKNVDQLMGEMREVTLSRGREGSMVTEGSQRKGKTAEMEEGKTSITKGGGDKGKYKRLEMPIFKGQHPDSWVYRAKQFFEIHELTKEEKIKVAVIGFDHDSVDWYRWSHNQSPIESWAELKKRMFARFRSSKEGSLTRRFLAIKQEGTYLDYRKLFECFSAPIPDISESVLEGTFINGLDPKLKAKVESRNPIGLDAAMREAQALDDEMCALKEIESGDGSRTTKGGGKSGGLDKTGSGNYYRPNTTKIQILDKNRAPRREGVTRRLSDVEVREKREKGLCFKCDEKYSPKHQCKTQEKREL